MTQIDFAGLESWTRAMHTIAYVLDDILIKKRDNVQITHNKIFVY